MVKVPILAEIGLVGGVFLLFLPFFLFIFYGEIAKDKADKDTVFMAGILLAAISALLLIFSTGVMKSKESLGKPILFENLTENQVYMVVEKLPEKNFALIEGKINGQDEERLAEIPIEYLTILHKGDKFVKTGANIAIIPP